jgi:hypothetical protein
VEAVLPKSQKESTELQPPPNLNGRWDGQTQQPKKPWETLAQKIPQGFSTTPGNQNQGDQAKKIVMEFLPTRLSTSFQRLFSHSLNS